MMETIEIKLAVKISKNADLEDSQAEAVVETINETVTTKVELQTLDATNETAGDLKESIATKEDFKTEIDKVLKHLYINSFARTVIALVALVVASGKFL